MVFFIFIKYSIFNTAQGDVIRAGEAAPVSFPFSYVSFLINATNGHLRQFNQVFNRPMMSMRCNCLPRLSYTMVAALFTHEHADPSAGNLYVSVKYF